VPLIGNGLKYSTDHGATYTKITNVTNCAAVAIGKADVSATYPTVFIWGTVGGVNGMFRSTNKGASWTRVNDDAHQFGGVNFVFADMNVFGRVYTSGILGRGLIYWDLPIANAIESETENVLNDMDIYPNPATNQVFVQLNSNVAENVEITIFDQAGRTIRSSQYYYNGNSPISFDISFISKGFYLLSVKNKYCTMVKKVFVDK
jgi:hypothetical protein